MEYDTARDFPASYDVQQVECRLCGRMSNVTECTDLLTVTADNTNNTALSIGFIQKKIGIKFKAGDGLPSTVCHECSAQIDVWSKFVQNCLNVQERFITRQTVYKPAPEVEKPASPESQPQPSPAPQNLYDEDLPEQPVKKSRFTLDYLRNKVGRELGEKEASRLQTLIDKGEDRGIFAFLFGSGANQTWPCQICSIIIRGTMREVTKHYTNEHQADPLFPCQMCGKVIKSAHTYKRHRTAHLSEYRCSECDKVFQDRSKLLAHLVAHSENRPHLCGVCGKSFKLSSHLKSHKDRAHLPESDRLAFTCEICGKRFSAKGNLTTHVQITHNDERKFVCDICGKGVKTKQALQHHLHSHNGDKLFSCSFCDMSFTSRASLASHTRRHTGERPYLCSICGKSFTSSSARSSHKQHVHATSRQHTCSVCGKSFKVMRDLRVHQSIHTGEKPHVCPVETCGRAFRVAANLYAHKKTHLKAQEKQQQEKEVQQQSLDAAVAEIGEFIQVVEPPLQPSINDALSQVIQEHLSHTLTVDDDQQQQQLTYDNVGPDEYDVSNVSTEADNHQGFLKEILMKQFDETK